VLEVLKMLGCDMVQGYFIEKPMSASSLPDWFESYNLSLVK